MTETQLHDRFAELAQQPIPLPGRGQTAERHQQLARIGREDLSLAKLVEAHYDAVAILAEAGRESAPGATYAVWASEAPGQTLTLTPQGNALCLSGEKRFASGAGIVDRALLTAQLKTATGTEDRLVEVDLRSQSSRLSIDDSRWATEAFQATHTSTVTFRDVELGATSLLGDADWYTRRAGFWQGACGPAACWAGGAHGLVDAALRSRRDDPHTLAHLAAMQAGIWAMDAMLDRAGEEIDRAPDDAVAAHRLALTLRHLVEQACTDILQRFARAYGPAPLALDADVSRRYHELQLYLRQCHGERDLEALGRVHRTGT